ncbi:flagellar associated protein [Salpingoeca rosetta]|uniref:Flagellar associated protein n=1 Tax=Salpingoeca rosetta (strain ATCC 50818 / BSB-021) TaxID=946362 RepID=F2UD39_SALR5|nr:flagellar associated protein [Salpingoeca rosetta]EGD74534.1 flagellar associated protein [Salpingoeca rosetta]|eukprot:XP_004992791.1 flagellar associated protein [Salpingoeca rosetta]
MYLRRALLATPRLLATAPRTLATMSGKDLFFLDDFALRQFNDDSYTGTRLKGSPEEFAKKVNELCTSEEDLKPGYAPFCKHVFVPNFVGALCPVIAITPEVEPLIVTAYKARTEKELPVLTRWVPAEKYEAKPAKMLDVILYSREQVIEERKAMGIEGDVPDCPWGIISVKAQDESYETPMQPITMLRNALGKEEGGSGVPLDREKYLESVAYWSKHVPLA